MKVHNIGNVGPVEDAIYFAVALLAIAFVVAACANVVIQGVLAIKRIRRLKNQQFTLEARQAEATADPAQTKAILNDARTSAFWFVVSLFAIPILSALFYESILNEGPLMIRVSNRAVFLDYRLDWKDTEIPVESIEGVEIERWTAWRRSSPMPLNRVVIRWSGSNSREIITDGVSHHVRALEDAYADIQSALDENN